MAMNWKQTFHQVSLVSAAATLLLSLVGYFFFLQPQIPLFYSLARVEDQMVNKEFVFIFPALALLIIFFENIQSTKLRVHETATEILAGGTALALILLCIALIRIMVLTA